SDPKGRFDAGSGANRLCRRAGRRGRLEPRELAAEIARDRPHAGDARLALGVGVVVGVRVDVVGVELAAAVADELDAGDADAVVGEESAIALDDRVREAGD